MSPDTELLHAKNPSPSNTQQTPINVQQPMQQQRNKATSLKALADGILSKSKAAAAQAGATDCNNVRNMSATSLLHRPDSEAVLLQHMQQPSEPVASPLTGMECSGCEHLEMRDEGQPGTRRRFWWRCRKGYELLEGRIYGGRVTISPPECDQFTAWKAGTK